jgi:hypothetical protein
VVTGLLLEAAGPPQPGLTVLRVVLAVIFLAWIVMLVLVLAVAAIVVTNRGRIQRRRALAARLAPARGGTAQRATGERATGRLARASANPADLATLRNADPQFDEQLLLDAALTATLLVFAATSTGDSAAISRLVTDSFWETPFGRLTRTTVRDRRREGTQQALDRASGRKLTKWHIPLDYQPSVPELVSVETARGTQKVSVRVSFDQLQAVVQPAAADYAAGAAATNFASAMISISKSVGTTANTPHHNEVSWLASGGRYDLLFVRPAGTRTDPSAALADRTCVTCGATYRSELAVACAHCGAERALPWGRWRLADAAPV